MIHRCEACGTARCVWMRLPGGFLKLWPVFGWKAGRCWGRWVRDGHKVKGKALAAILFTKSGWDAFSK